MPRNEDHLTPQERNDAYRRRYLPEQLERARLKVLHLEREAVRLGLKHLVKRKKDRKS